MASSCRCLMWPCQRVRRSSTLSLWEPAAVSRSLLLASLLRYRPIMFARNSLSLCRAPENCYKQLTQSLAHQIAATEHKAFLYHTPSGLLAVPMHVRQLSASQQASLPASSSLSAYGHEVAFDGAYVYYVRDKRIKFHTRVTHSQANKRTRSYGSNEPRQIYRSASTSTCFSTSVAVALCNIPALSKHMYAHKQ